MTIRIVGDGRENHNRNGSLKVLSGLAPSSPEGKHLTSQDRHLFIFQLNFPRCMNESLLVYFIQDFIGHLPYSRNCGSYTTQEVLKLPAVPNHLEKLIQPFLHTRLHANRCVAMGQPCIKRGITNHCRKERLFIKTMLKHLEKNPLTPFLKIFPGGIKS